MTELGKGEPVVANQVNMEPSLWFLVHNLIVMQCFVIVSHQLSCFCAYAYKNKTFYTLSFGNALYKCDFITTKIQQNVTNSAEQVVFPFTETFNMVLSKV